MNQSPPHPRAGRRPSRAAAHPCAAAHALASLRVGSRSPPSLSSAVATAAPPLGADRCRSELSPLPLPSPTQRLLPVLPSVQAAAAVPPLGSHSRRPELSLPCRPRVPEIPPLTNVPFHDGSPSPRPELCLPHWPRLPEVPTPSSTIGGLSVDSLAPCSFSDGRHPQSPPNRPS